MGAARMSRATDRGSSWKGSVEKAIRWTAGHAARPVKAVASATRQFLRLESAGGILLFAAAALGIVAVNSPLSELYDDFVNLHGAVEFADLSIEKPLVLWVNDFWMAIFFLLVGLEIKREIVEGALSSWDWATLPVVGALGGFALPALIFLGINWGDPETMNGWAIPAATDIAFALGVLTLFGRRVPVTLKIFLLALAIVDDIAAIAVIALFYTEDFSFAPLAIALIGLMALLVLNVLGVGRLWLYMAIALAIWVCVLKSGVHATLAGVAVAFLVPLESEDGRRRSVDLERILHPWVAYLILPVFAFVNAGVSLEGLSRDVLTEPLPLGIIAGLFLGKQIGVLGASWIAMKAGLCRLPDGVGWLAFYGVCVLTGVGFTMSLFIGSLAFTDEETLGAVRFGVLTGSVLSALVGYALLRATLRGEDAAPEGAERQSAGP